MTNLTVIELINILIVSGWEVADTEGRCYVNDEGSSVYFGDYGIDITIDVNYEYEELNATEAYELLF